MKKILFSTLAALLLTACSHFDTINKDPYSLYNAPAEEYVHPIVFKTTRSSIDIFRNNTCLLMQQGVNHNTENTSRIISNYNIAEGIIDDAWLSYYIQYGNAIKMYDQAVADMSSPVKSVKQNAKGLQGVALILCAHLMMQITDTYGDVPFKEAGALIRAVGEGKYTTAYDSQKDIYYGIIAMFEDANKLLGESIADGALSFSATCDKTFQGSFDKWRRFGNSLYLRALMRVAMKVTQDEGGVIEFNDGKHDDFAIADKLYAIYQSYLAGDGLYPVMRGRQDRPMVHFDKNNETEQTPFFSLTSGSWNAVTACTTLCESVLEGTYKIFELDSAGVKIKPFGDKLLWQATAKKDMTRASDPRYACWFRKLDGMPTQMLRDDHEFYYNHFRSGSGNFLGGSMMRGGETEVDQVWGQIHDLQNASEYPLMQFSELPFIFAEAGARGWISTITFAGVQTLLRKAVTESVLEWNTYFTESSDEVVNYVNWVMQEKTYVVDPGIPAEPLSPNNAKAAIMTEKWIAQFFIGIESWCDYRRTGFPLLKTNGPAAGNDQILPTRMRYPSDEAYRNVDAYNKAINGWLKGSNNMTVDVWWASTVESTTNREKGRQ